MTADNVNEIAGRTSPNRQMWHPKGTRITVLRILLAILQLATAYFLRTTLPKRQTSTPSFTIFQDIGSDEIQHHIVQLTLLSGVCLGQPQPIYAGKLVAARLHTPDAGSG